MQTASRNFVEIVYLPRSTARLVGVPQEIRFGAMTILDGELARDSEAHRKQIYLSRFARQKQTVSGIDK